MAYLLRNNWPWTVLAFLIGAILTWLLLTRRTQSTSAAAEVPVEEKTLVGAGVAAAGTPSAPPVRYEEPVEPFDQTLHEPDPEPVPLDVPDLPEEETGHDPEPLPDPEPVTEPIAEPAAMSEPQASGEPTTEAAAEPAVETRELFSTTPDVEPKPGPETNAASTTPISGAAAMSEPKASGEPTAASDADATAKSEPQASGEPTAEAAVETSELFSTTADVEPKPGPETNAASTTPISGAAAMSEPKASGEPTTEAEASGEPDAAPSASPAPVAASEPQGKVAGLQQAAFSVRMDADEPTLFDDHETANDVQVTSAPVPAGKYGEGSADAVAHQGPPDGFTIKGNAQSMLFHTPESPYYGRTKAEVWFRAEADAERAGFTKYVRKPRKSSRPRD
jgi:hypothetical protein